MTTQTTGEVVANVALAPETHILTVRAPEIARHAAAGQFVHVRCGDRCDPLLRRPFSIMRLGDPHAGPFAEFELLVEVVGRGSDLLARAKPGDLIDLLGPLGRGFALHPNSRRVLLVAGGIGIAPLITLAQDALRREAEVTVLFGAKTAAKVFPALLLPPAIEYVVHTDDGSAGRAGFVTDSVPELLIWADQVFACGPTSMFRTLAKTVQQTLTQGIVLAMSSRSKRRTGQGSWLASPPRFQVSLEQRMGCAMGACYGCVVDTNAGRQRVCRDGPVFDLFEVEW